MFVTLEGIDNAGKTTLCGLLQERLAAEGREVVVTRELTTDIGSVLYHELKCGEVTSELKVLLFAADRLQRQGRDVCPALERGALVIADRWVHSAVAYRLAEVDASSRAELLRYVNDVNRWCLKPDLAMYIDIDSTVSALRRSRLEG